jgi:ABC-2 type transport system ATP-binding protein
VLGLVGLADVAGRKVGGFSLGMRQRLGLAYTLLGDPGVLVLDEPANGLDPEGIRWLRGFLGSLAREGRTVLVSSHMLAEVQQTVSALLIISRGRLVYQGDMSGLTQPGDYSTVIDSPDRGALAAALDAAGIDYDALRTGFTVRSAEPAQLGAIAAAAGIALSNLQRKGPRWKRCSSTSSTARGCTRRCRRPRRNRRPNRRPNPNPNPNPSSHPITLSNRISTIL